MKKYLGLGLLITVLILNLAACGSSAFKDGLYDGEYVSDSNNTTQVSITITDGVISACEASFLDPKGNIKDENYCIDMKYENPVDFEKAQISVQGMVQYADMLVETGSTDEMEAVSGATVSYKDFCEAVKDALSKAQ